jgi:anaerobic selenocysteine-containing dehydrogenase
VEVNPADAKSLGLNAAGCVVVESRRGRIKARPFVTATIARGHLFIPMHDESTNRLTDPVFDPESRQPAYKSCAVRIRPSTASEIIDSTNSYPAKFTKALS